MDEDLCPKPSDVSSTSDISVIIVNNRCLYAACHNFDQFTNKMKEFIHGNRGDDADFKDDLVYVHFIPVKYTESQLSEIKFQSSLLQILEQEMVHVQTDEVSIKCKGCDLAWCSCHSEKESMSNVMKEPLASHKSPHYNSTSADNSKKIIQTDDKSIEQEVGSIPSQLTNNSAGPSVNINRLEHEREPKLRKYVRYIEPRTCLCAKSSKKHLDEHLPAYMRNMSMFDGVELPNYETCSDVTLKKLVKEAKSERTPSIVAISSKTKDICTQCSDEKFDLLCLCLSNNNTDSFEPIRNKDQFISGNISPSYMKTTLSKFAVDRAHSLRQIVDGAPELKDIFNEKI